MAAGAEYANATRLVEEPSVLVAPVSCLGNITFAYKLIVVSAGAGETARERSRSACIRLTDDSRWGGGGEAGDERHPVWIRWFAPVL